jgi:hypothetical protein
MKRIFLTIFLSFGTFFGCSHYQNTKRVPASVKEVGVTLPHGEVIVHYLEGNDIIVKACDSDTTFWKTPEEARRNCLGKSSKIPVERFKLADSSKRNRHLEIRKLDEQIAEAVNLIIDTNMLTPAKFNSVKDQCLYTVLKELNPNQKFPCGLTGSVDERIKDCSSQITSQKGGFVLVARSKDFKEVYKEVSTDLLWSDRLSYEMSHENGEKACMALLTEAAGISDSNWRLPTIKEFSEAERNGIRNALPNMNYWFWSSTIHRYYPTEAYLFFGNSGQTDNYHYRKSDRSVRCVAREK